jgi:acetoin utilization protein AcuC
MDKTALVYNSEIKNYHFGNAHPFKSGRFEIFVNFLKTNLPNFNDYFEEILPEPAKDKDLDLAHSKEYIEAIEKASKGIIIPNISEYASVDNLDPLTGYLPKGIEKAARLIVGTSLLAGELVFKGKPRSRTSSLRGRFKKAIGIGGGLHHAKWNYGEGFCVYNDVVVCAKNLLNKGAKKILILDTDAHAGNGTAEAFYEDNHVLFIDLHQDPRTIYPGTGFINEIGKGKGEGFTINIPLPPGASDLACQYCFDEIIFPIAKEFKPELIIRYGGSDPYFNDSLTQLGLTLEGFKIIGEKVKTLADEVCQGKEIDLLASGYNQEILAKAWLAILTGLLDLPVDKKLFEEKIGPQKDSGLKETKEIVKELKNILKKYWKCF